MKHILYKKSITSGVLGIVVVRFDEKFQSGCVQMYEIFNKLVIEVGILDIICEVILV